MSSPIGHTLAGYLIYVIGKNQKADRQLFNSKYFKGLKPDDYGVLLIYFTIANVPDLDFLPGLMVGHPNLYHHGISHSLGAALFFSGICALLYKFTTLKSYSVSFGTAMLLYCSHLVLDMLCLDGRPPFGIPVFWPLSSTNLYMPVLPPVKHSFLDDATIGQFLTDVFSIHNLGVVLMECLLAGGMLIVFFMLKRVVYTLGSRIQ